MTVTTVANDIIGLVDILRQITECAIAREKTKAIAIKNIIG